MNIPWLQIEPNASYNQNLKRTYKMRQIVCLSNSSSKIDSTENTKYRKHRCTVCIHDLSDLKRNTEQMPFYKTFFIWIVNIILNFIHIHINKFFIFFLMDSQSIFPIREMKILRSFKYEMFTEVFLRNTYSLTNKNHPNKNKYQTKYLQTTKDC